MNSRAKGARGERAWRDKLREQGYEAKRGQQHCGGADSPDVICEDLKHFLFEVKCVEKLNIEDAMIQARRDAGTAKTPIVAHKRNHCNWLITMDSDTFFSLIRNKPV